MKTLKLLLLFVAGASAASAGAQASADADRFSPLATGYIERARTMSREQNFAGVIDQLRHIHTQNIRLARAEAEEYTFLLAEAYYERDDAECLRLLLDFRDTYPASPLAPKASRAVADYYFFRHDWPRAVEAFEELDLDRLNSDDRLTYSYRYALSLIHTGHYEEARPLIDRLEGVRQFQNAYNYYTAYLDYIDGDYDSAYNLFMKSATEPGMNPGYYMAQIQYLRGEYENVIKNGSSLLRKQVVPELAPEIQRIVGLSYFRLDQPLPAEGFLESYLEKTPGTPEPDALYAMGAIDYMNGRYATAIDRFKEVTDRPDAISQGAWLYLGQCYLKQDNAASAALAFDKAARLSYDRNVTETALYNYVTTLTRGGKIPFASSANMLEEFIKTYPNSEFTPEIEAYMASAYFNDRDYEKALTYINYIRKPTAANLTLKQKIYYELGIEASTNGHPEKAAGYLRNCVELRKYDAALADQASLWLGDALFSTGRYKEARDSYAAFTRSGQGSENRALGFYDLGYANYKLGNYAEAASNFASALGAKPALAAKLADDALIRRADCLYYTGKYAEASAAFTKAIDAGVTDADYALLRRSVLRGLAGDTKSRLADLTRLERDFPESRWLSNALLEQAHVYEETGHADLAATAYKKRLGTTANVDIDELLRMASAMNEASRWDDLLTVVDHIRHAGGLEPDEVAEIDLYEADALRHLGRTSEADAIYAEIAQNPTSLPGSKAIVTIAETDIAKGRFEQARVRMEEFTDTGTPHQYWLARGFIALADAYHGLGQKQMAREYLTSLLENYPGTEEDIRTRINTRLKKWR